MHSSSTNVLAVSRIQQALAAVNGYTLYAVSHLDAEGKPGDDADDRDRPPRRHLRGDELSR